MKNEIKELMKKDKSSLTADEIMLVFNLCKIKKNENTVWTDIVLLLSPITIILGIVNLFTPIFTNAFSLVLNYIAAIPACLNIAIKIREYSIKKKFMKEYDISRKEMKEILKSDQMKVFEEVIKEITNNTVELGIYSQKDDTFADFDFKEDEVRIDMVKAKNEVYSQEPKKRNLLRRIVKKKKSANASKGSEDLADVDKNDDNNISL